MKTILVLVTTQIRLRYHQRRYLFALKEQQREWVAILKELDLL